MSSRLKIALTLLAGACGLAIAGANLPVDTQLTIRTQLGKRTQPHWLVPADSKIVKTEGGSGLIRLLGGLIGCVGFGAAMHLAGTDEREQRLFWDKQIAINGIHQKESEVSAEISAGVRLKKLQMEAQAEVDFYSLQLQGKFREAIGFTPIPDLERPALTHAKPGTLDEITNPSDKIEDNLSDKHLIESTDSLTRALLNSQIGSLLFAGFLKLIGTPGSGKTTLTSALLRCRIHRGHQLVIVNSHKRKSMYQEIEKFLFTGTTVYGVGLGDDQRAKSLIEGLTKILDLLSVRYDEYQNQDECSYSHFPVTLLLEEIGEWEPLLALVMPLPEVEILLQNFWRKLFIAARKGKLFPLVTAQVDTQAMFKAKGLSSLFKKSGAVTLTLTAEPDFNSEDGWKPSGQGELNSPNSPSRKVSVPDVRALISDVDYFGDSSLPVTNATGGEVVEPPPASTTSPPPLHRQLHQLESLLHQDFTTLHPIPANWHFPDPMQLLTPEVKAVVVACKRNGMTQNVAILAIWGVPKSGSDKRYEAARSHYQSVEI